MSRLFDFDERAVVDILRRLAQVDSPGKRLDTLAAVIDAYFRAPPGYEPIAGDVFAAAKAREEMVVNG